MAFIKQIEEIMSEIDEKIEREKKTRELSKLVNKFVLANEKLNDIILACQFVLEISKNNKLRSTFEKLKDDYENLRSSLIDLWGENPDKVEILEPLELYEPLDKIIATCNLLETEIQEILRQMRKEVKNAQELANSLSIIPDVNIDLQIFEKTNAFLLEVGLNTADIADFIERSKKVCIEKIKKWNSLLKKLKKEEKKLDFRSIKGKKISNETLAFLQKFIDNRGEVDFKDLNGKIVDELKMEFPQLCKKLKVSISW